MRYDFNHGARVQVPQAGWRVRMRDLDTNTVVLDRVLEAGEIAASRRKYFVRLQFDVFDGARLVFSHAFDATWRRVRMEIAPGALGDALAWMPAIEAFRQQHDCAVSVPLTPALRALFEDGYPELRFVDDTPDTDAPLYATYRIARHVPYTDRDHQPTDPRVSSLQDFASYLLGVPAIERRANIALADRERPIPERYVCIATDTPTQSQHWNNPGGWPTLVAHLRACGYRVVCVDGRRKHVASSTAAAIGAGAEGFAVQRPLPARANLIAHADFFIGSDSGLSWLAWTLGTPTVLIGGFSHPKTGFHTPWHVINFRACNSCYNDTALAFDGLDPNWCPRHADDALRFQCSTAITPEQVMHVIEPLVAMNRR